MSKNLNKKEIEKFSRQIILKDIGPLGQKKIKDAKVLIVGAGGLGCPVAEFLTRAGVGSIGIIDNDVVNLSNIHRQSLYNINDVNKLKVKSAKKKLNEMNPNTFTEKNEFKALKGGRTWNYPALANGLLFVRNSHEMACFDLRLKSD